MLSCIFLIKNMAYSAVKVNQPIVGNVKKVFSSVNDLSIQQKVLESKNKIGDVITFEITVSNDGKTTVNGVVVKNTLPQGLDISAVTVSIGTTQVANGILRWNLGTIVANKETLLIKGVITQSGVINNTAEIESSDGEDIDSTPNNGILLEDDIANACVSVPYIFCSDETVALMASAPTGFSGYQWFKDGKLIVNAKNKDYTISEVGIYTFTANTVETGYSCTVKSCCPIIVEKKPQIQLIATDVLKPKCSEASGKVTLKVVGSMGNFTFSKDGTNYKVDNVFTNLSVGQYTFYVKDDIGCITSLNFSLITVDTLQPTVPVIVANTTKICQDESVTLTASTCNGNVLWNTGSTNSVITVKEGVYSAKCSLNCQISNSSNFIEITKDNPNVPVITSDRLICCDRASATLQASGCNGKLAWNTGATTSAITVNVSGTYVATCTNKCGIAVQSKSIEIRTVTRSSPTITVDKASICSLEKATLVASTCDGTVKWSTDATGNSISVSAAGTYSAVCETICGVSSKSNEIVIFRGVVPASPVISTNKEVLCGGDVATLIANGCNGTVKWSTNATGSIISINEAGTYTAACVNNCGESGKSNLIIITKQISPISPTIVSSKSTICAGEEIILTATGCINNAFLWNVESQTTSTIKVTPLVSTSYSVVCKNSCESSKNSINITVNNGSKPITIVGPAESVCAGSKVPLIATGCDTQVIWSNGLTGTSINVTVTKDTTYSASCSSFCDFSEGDVSFRAVGGTTGTGISTKYILTDSNGIILQINTVPTFSNLLKGTYKAFSLVFESTIAGLSVGGRIDSLKASCIVLNEKVFTVCSKVTSCDSFDMIEIKSIQPTQFSINATQTKICENQNVILKSSTCAGVVMWNNGVSGTSIAVSTIGTYSATCKTNCGTIAVSNTISIERKFDCTENCNIGIPVISASKSTICKSEEIVLKASNCSATVSWSTGQTGTSIKVKPVTNSIYYAVCKLSNTCISPISNKIEIKINDLLKPSIICQDSLACNGQKITLKVNGCDGQVIWSNGILGTSINVIVDGKTAYTAKCKINDCESALSDSVVVAIGQPNKPYILCTNTNICYGQKSTLVARNCNGIVVWSNGQKGEILITEPNTKTTTYHAICKSIYGDCISEKSNEVVLNLLSPIAKPLVITTISNICPFNTSDLNSAILSEPVSPRGQFEFHTLPSPSSLLVTNPSIVFAGNYYVFERSVDGCYSDFAEIKVNKVTCEGGGVEPNIKNVDILVNISASTKTSKTNDTVRYTIKVKNLSKNKATGVVLRNILPNELEFISGQSNLTIQNRIISLKVDSLKSGDSAIFSYLTKVLYDGRIMNQVELYKLNELDTLSSNNISKFILNEMLLYAGISKVAGKPTLVKEKIFDVPFKIYLNNLTNDNIKNIQVYDDLERTFGKGVKILTDTIKISASSGLVVNKNYTGKGNQTFMLIDSLSSIEKKRAYRLDFTVKVDLVNATDSVFYNLAELIYNGTKDISTNGVEVDPDADGDPTNNQDPTPIFFDIDIKSLKPLIGLSMTLVDNQKQDEKCYQLTYLVLVKNFGNTKLTNVLITDTLSKTFADSVSFNLIGKVNSGKKSTLLLNPNFDGKNDFRLTLADSSSYLSINQQDSLFFAINLCTTGKLGPFKNNSYAQAIGSGILVNDVSNNGLEIKISDSTPTIALLAELSNIIIPQGFSPNGDGKNDSFIISIAKDIQIESIDIYNRWGSLVYCDTTGLVAKQGWNGEVNAGIRNDRKDLPTGTYFYVIKIKKKEEIIVGFVELAR